MTLSLARTNRRTGSAGFTLAEILVSFLVFALMVGGLCYGYVQANRMAQWSAMSLAAQSYASQGLEQVRSAQWNYEQWPYASGPGTGDEFPPTTNSAGGITNVVQIDTLDVPSTGDPIPITNYISVIQITGTPPLRQIRSDVVWAFPLDGTLCTNTAITMRAPDQ
jgi:type II secretory pathway pseudopilin PulG